jgi:hypothetical protein
VAEPWTDDFAALAAHTREQAPVLATTRARFLSTPEKSSMRFFKNRPLLAVLLVLALVGAASGAVYAVDKVFLQIDPDKSAPEIESDVTQQLQNAGVATLGVHAEKTDGEVRIEIQTTDEQLGSALDVGVAGVPGADVVHELGIDDGGKALPIKFDTQGTELTKDQQNAMITAAIDHRVIDAMHAYKTAEHPDPSPLSTALTQALAERGFDSTRIEILPTEIVVTVTAAPVAK